VTHTTFSFPIAQDIPISIPIAVPSQSLNRLPAMATELPTSNGIAANGDPSNQQSVKEGLARMLKGGVIMDVVNAEQVRLTPFISILSH
jgi:hypothetical protein